MNNLFYMTAKFLSNKVRYFSGSKFRSIRTHLPEGSTTKMNMTQSINHSLDLVLGSDLTSVVFGEDVAFGGVFRCTSGLQLKYGTDRVFDTPINELGIVGFAIGYASMNRTAIAEIQFADYLHTSFDQIFNEAAKIRYRSGGMFDCGRMIIRTPSGAVGHGGHYHSQSPENIYATIPGIKMVIPRGPVQAKGLLISSIREMNPVIFFEPKILYRNAVEEVPDGDYTLSIGKAEVLQIGSDVTIISYGSQIYCSLDASDIAKEKLGVSCEIIDLQTLSPIDEETITNSVMKTGRAIIVHEGSLTGGIGGEVSATLMENCFSSMKSAIQRVCGLDTHIPLTHETFVIPNKYRIYDAIKTIIN